MFSRLNPLCIILVLTLVLSGCSPRQYTAKVKDQKVYPVSGDSPVDSVTLAYYKPYKEKIDSLMNVVIGTAAAEIRSQKPEGALNNLCTDALAYVAKKNNIHFDLVHLNLKGLRVHIPEGPVKTSRIYELMPFENLLVTVQLTGNQLRELFTYMAARGGDPIAGASFLIEAGKAKDILIKGEPLDPASVYTILTHDYLANGGDDANVYIEASGRKEYPIKVRDAFLDFIRSESRAGRKIDPKIEGRVRTVN